MTECIIDNATIFSIGRIFERQSNNLIVREINIQSLDSLLETYVLNDFIYVEEKYWEIFLKNVPDEWHKEFKEIFIPINLIEPDLISLKEFLSSDIIFWILNLFIDTVKSTNIYYDFMTYTGQDFDNYRLVNNSEILFEIDKVLKEKWNWDYHHANPDHIDSILMCYRTYEYLQLASRNDKNIILHPLRNQLITLIGQAYGLTIPKQTTTEIYDKIVNKIQKLQEGNVFRNIQKFKDDNRIKWNSINFPFIPAIIYEQSETSKEIFKQAKLLRKEFEPFRQTVDEINESYENSDFEQLDNKLSKIYDFIANLNIENNSNKVEYCFQIGLPFSFALGFTNKDNTPKYLKIFNELKFRFNLPKSYIYSCQRLFGNIRWNEKTKIE